MKYYIRLGAFRRGEFRKACWLYPSHDDLGEAMERAKRLSVSHVAQTLVQDSEGTIRYLVVPQSEGPLYHSRSIELARQHNRALARLGTEPSGFGAWLR